MEQKTSLIMGLWKFSDRISRDELIKLAGEWAQDEKYVELYVREAGKNQNGIGFAVRSDGTKDAQESYFFEVGGELKKKFGGDFIAWDMATTHNLIKGYENLK